MAARFRMSNKGVGQLLKSNMVRDEMRRRAEVIKGVAESIAPVGGPGDPHPGQYKASFGVVTSYKGGFSRDAGNRADRVVATVYNTAPYARWIEYGNGGTVRAHHVMLRAAQAGGR